MGKLQVFRARREWSPAGCALTNGRDWPDNGQVFGTLRKWGEFVKFSHTVFALPFALASMAIGAWDNRGWPGLEEFLLILAAMVGGRQIGNADAMKTQTSTQR